MDIKAHILVLDAADPEPEAAFWAGMLGGTAHQEDDDWWSVRVGESEALCVQLAPGQRAPEWPDGLPQQMHLDLVVAEIASAHDEALGWGATVLQEAEDLTDEHGFQVYADPAGHPFCLCW